MTAPTCFVIMGPKAVGKSWVADVLARRHGVHHVDADELILDLVAQGLDPAPDTGWLTQVERAVEHALATHDLVSIEATGAWESDWLLIDHLRNGGVTVRTVWVEATLAQSLERLRTRRTRKVPTSDTEAVWYHENASKRSTGVIHDLVVDTRSAQDEEGLVADSKALFENDG